MITEEIQKNTIMATKMEMAYYGKLLKEDKEGRVFRFKYERAKTDPNPRVLVLGRWQHPETKNKLVAGLNLNYLTKDELARLNNNLEEIMSPAALRTRWWTGYGLLPDIWMKAYRQYDERYVHGARQTDFSPDTDDYIEPQGAASEPPGATEKEIAKLKELEAKRTGEEPKDKERSIWRMGKGTIRKIINYLKKKLSRKDKGEKKASALKSLEKEKEQEQERTIDDLERLEQEKEAEEAEELEDEIEDDEEHRESFESRLNTIIESKNKRLRWKSYNNYIYWHRPDKFVEYQDKLKGSICDYAQGGKLTIVCNNETGDMVIDFCDNINDVLLESGWSWDQVTSVVVGQDSEEILNEINNAGHKRFIQEVLAAFQ